MLTHTHPRCRRPSHPTCRPFDQVHSLHRHCCRCKKTCSTINATPRISPIFEPTLPHPLSPALAQPVPTCKSATELRVGTATAHPVTVAAGCSEGHYPGTVSCKGAVTTTFTRHTGSFSRRKCAHAAVCRQASHQRPEDCERI
jgi:hypothetical protein